MKPILDACCGGKMFYYDCETHRTPFEARHRIKYGIRFMPADD